MLHVALWEPEIPPNTGNIARLCAATGSRLHLIGRLGFQLDEKAVRRAGLDYWHAVDWHHHTTWDDFLRTLGSDSPAFLSSGRGWLIDNPAPRSYTQARFQDGDVLVFGSETRGLPESLKQPGAERLLGIPMSNDAVRSLNLSNAVAIVVYEALRQIRGW
jgi:tRNA (cytidine/uridine-2'-O-)-methyltransferase